MAPNYDEVQIVWNRGTYVFSNEKFLKTTVQLFRGTEFFGKFLFYYFWNIKIKKNLTRRFKFMFYKNIF